MKKIFIIFTFFVLLFTSCSEKPKENIATTDKITSSITPSSEVNLDHSNTYEQHNIGGFKYCISDHSIELVTPSLYPNITSGPHIAALQSFLYNEKFYKDKFNGIFSSETEMALIKWIENYNKINPDKQLTYDSNKTDKVNLWEAMGFKITFNQVQILSKDSFYNNHLSNAVKHGYIRPLTFEPLTKGSAIMLSNAPFSDVDLKDNDINVKGVYIAVIQSFLFKNGLYNSSIDGIFGNVTKNSISKWQKQYNSNNVSKKLRVDGIVDYETMIALGFRFDSEGKLRTGEDFFISHLKIAVQNNFSLLKFIYDD